MWNASNGSFQHIEMENKSVICEKHVIREKSNAKDEICGHVHDVITRLR